MYRFPPVPARDSSCATAFSSHERSVPAFPITTLWCADFDNHDHEENVIDEATKWMTQTAVIPLSQLPCPNRSRLKNCRDPGLYRTTRRTRGHAGDEILSGFELVIRGVTALEDVGLTTRVKGVVEIVCGVGGFLERGIIDGYFREGHSFVPGVPVEVVSAKTSASWSGWCVQQGHWSVGEGTRWRPCDERGVWSKAVATIHW